MVRFNSEKANNNVARSVVKQGCITLDWFIYCRTGNAGFAGFERPIYARTPCRFGEPQVDDATSYQRKVFIIRSSRITMSETLRNICTISAYSGLQSFTELLRWRMSEKGSNASIASPSSNGANQLSPDSGVERRSIQDLRNAPSNAMSLASTVPKTVSKWRRVISYLKWILFDQWFLFALGLLILIASQVQVPQSRQHENDIVVT